jgi:triosephosphate isomerase
MKKYFIANWKMNNSIPSSIEFCNSIADFLSSYSNNNLEVVICPSFMSVPYAYQLLKPFAKIGSQNITHLDENVGAFTGEISAGLIKDYSDFVILGHSERRVLLNESNYEVSKKVEFASKNNISKIICIGENEEQRKAGNFLEILANQAIQSIGQNNSNSDLSKTIIAYEPLWAIGSGSPCSIEDVLEVTNYIKENVPNINGIVYGGSVNDKNISEFFKSKDLNGVLVGSAALNLESFKNMLNFIS